MSRSATLRAGSGLVLALTVMAAARPAAADQRWEHHGGWDRGHVRHDWHDDRGGGVGAGLAGALLGLGVGAAVGAAVAAPPVVVAPAPVYAPPPVYYGAPPVAYAPPPPVYYGP